MQPGGLNHVQALIEHCDHDIEDQDFLEAFECGDELFETRFNAVDGGGMEVGDGGRYTRVPRADLANWSTMIPARATGPNGEACNVCHLAETVGGAGDGSGPISVNAIRDPLHTGTPGMFIQRNTPHLFGMAGPQLLAEEMTADLHQAVDDAIALACPGPNNQSLSVPLESKGIDFGTAIVSRPCNNPKISVTGDAIASDLIVRPFQWKGNEISIRSFSRGAFHNELGMQPVELAGDDVDNDFDGVVNEITVADVTAMEVYLAGQPRPTTLLELDALRQLLEADGIDGAHLAEEIGLPHLTAGEIDDINAGEALFENVDLGCVGCHTPSLPVANAEFSSPSANPLYRETELPAGQDVTGHPGLDPALPITFDITADMPDNQIELPDSGYIIDVGNFVADGYGGAIVELYGDLRLHDMGPGLAENIDESGAGASVWMTKELWGLGNTAPYLHDGRATTIEEAILLHGGEAEESRNAFAGLSYGEQAQVLAFLNSLVLFLPGEEE